MSVAVRLPIGETRDVQVTWKMIDNATAEYTKTLHEFDMSQIVKTFVELHGRTKTIGVLPMPGNLELADTELGFPEFLRALEAARGAERKLGYELPASEVEKLRSAAGGIVKDPVSGKHSRDEKKFSGWKRSFTMAKKGRKKVVLGLVSLDIAKADFSCAGTQHYIAFCYDLSQKKLWIFDSAAKTPHKEHSEVYYLLKFTLEELVGDPIHARGLVFRNILQPGAGDRTMEDLRSINNQNVFCHTWALWFCMLVCFFYDPKESGQSIRKMQSVSHRQQVYNLAMIKRFAKWLVTDVLLEEESIGVGADKKFATRAFERSRLTGDNVRMQEVLELYTLHKDPFLGLDWIYEPKTAHILSTRDLSESARFRGKNVVVK